MNIEKFINVSPETRAQIRKTWENSEMAPNAPLHSCASCGIRDDGNYDKIAVADLPDYFKFKPKDQAMFDKLKGETFSILCFYSTETAFN
jgi:hypothetical protein